MTSDHWGPVLAELVAQGLPCLPASDGGSPWLSYAAVARLTGLAATTIEDKCSGLERHPAGGGMVRVSDLEAKLRKAKA